MEIRRSQAKIVSLAAQIEGIRIWTELKTNLILSVLPQYI